MISRSRVLRSCVGVVVVGGVRISRVVIMRVRRVVTGGGRVGHVRKRRVRRVASSALPAVLRTVLLIIAAVHDSHAYCLDTRTRARAGTRARPPRAKPYSTTRRRPHHTTRVAILSDPLYYTFFVTLTLLRHARCIYTFKTCSIVQHRINYSIYKLFSVLKVIVIAERIECRGDNASRCEGRGAAPSGR